MPPKDSAPTEGEIWASRFNVGLARSQRVISSWLSQPMHTTAEDSSDEDFKVADERAPIGAKPKDDGLPESVRRSRISNDKLLEQIIGKRAANAKRKAQQDAGKHGAGVTKPVVRVATKVAESDDEEDGRAAAFSSKKKTKQQKPPVSVSDHAEADDVVDENVEPPDSIEDGATIKDAAGDDSEEDERPKKRKANSYLDEVLAKKAKKSKKKKKKAAAT